MTGIMLYPPIWLMPRFAWLRFSAFKAPWQRGFSRIGEFFSSEITVAKAAGLRSGSIQGALGATLILGIVWVLVQNNDSGSAHEIEGKTILHTMETTQAPVEAEPDQDSSGDVPL